MICINIIEASNIVIIYPSLDKLHITEMKVL